MAGGVVVRPAGLGDDADVLRLDAQGDDFALEFAADLLEGTDFGHVISPWLFRARDHRGLDGDRRAEGDRRRTRSGRSTAEDGGGESFLPREEWASAQGKKVDPPPLRLRRSRRSRPSARSVER